MSIDVLFAGRVVGAMWTSLEEIARSALATRRTG
jgi:hypothetical protein